MAKENFAASPMMQFITKTPAESAEIEQQTAKGAKPKAPRRDNCITPPAERARIAKANSRYKAAPVTDYRAEMDAREPRSRRVQLMMKPSVYNELRHMANRKFQSVNHLLETILTEYIEKENGSK